MATTVTAVAAQSTAVPKANHYTNIVTGTLSGTLSASGSGMALLAAIPPNAENVQLIARHVSGATTGVLNYGIRGEGGSLTASALGSSLASGTTHISPPYDLTWDEAGGERRKFVTATLVSGTVTSAFVINYQVTYDIGG